MGGGWREWWWRSGGRTRRSRARRGRGRRSRRQPTGIAGPALVFVLGWMLARLLWTPLSWSASLENVFISTAWGSARSVVRAVRLTDGAVGLDARDMQRADVRALVAAVHQDEAVLV